MSPDGSLVHVSSTAVLGEVDAAEALAQHAAAAANGSAADVDASRRPSVTSSASLTSPAALWASLIVCIALVVLGSIVALNMALWRHRLAPFVLPPLCRCLACLLSCSYRHGPGDDELGSEQALGAADESAEAVAEGEAEVGERWEGSSTVSAHACEDMISEKLRRIRTDHQLSRCSRGVIATTQTTSTPPRAAKTKPKCAARRGGGYAPVACDDELYDKFTTEPFSLAKSFGLD